VENPFVSVVIPVLNEERYIAPCLTSILGVNYPSDRLEIILVDNGSTDKTLEIAQKFDVDIQIKEGVNVGAVRNFGAGCAEGDVLVFLDSDCVIDEHWLMGGVSLLDSGLDAVGGLYILRDNPSWVESSWILKSAKEFLYQSTLVGGCIFIKKSVFDSLGGFNEAMSAGEDTDLTRRLSQGGFQVSIDPALSIVHLGYPNTISSFVKRQMWHSEDYYQNFPGVLSDKVFLATQTFLLGLLIFFCYVLNLLPVAFGLVALFLVIACPALLTVKRLKRYKIGLISADKLFKIFILDVMYLLGRVFGSCRSLKKLIFRSSHRKYERR